MAALARRADEAAPRAPLGQRAATVCIGHERRSDTRGDIVADIPFELHLVRGSRNRRRRARGRGPVDLARDRGRCCSRAATVASRGRHIHERDLRFSSAWLLCEAYRKSAASPADTWRELLHPRYIADYDVCRLLASDRASLSNELIRAKRVAVGAGRRETTV